MNQYYVGVKTQETGIIDSEVVQVSIKESCVYVPLSIYKIFC